MLDITHIGYLNLPSSETFGNIKERSLATFQKLRSFLHYRQDCLFKPRPVFSIGNLENVWITSMLRTIDKLKKL
jgi:hypothetical protein